MAAPTIYRLAEQALSLIEGAGGATASTVTIEDLKLALGQVINQLLKIDYFSVNGKMGETIPNGSVLALYEGIAVERSNDKSYSTLPIKPLKLPRNMGVWSIFPKYTTSSNYEMDKEFIPLQMGQSALIKSQPMLNGLLGQVGYECLGDRVYFTTDIKNLFPDVLIAMRLVIMDVSQYGDYDILPILPEQEMAAIQEVVRLYSVQPVADRVVDATNKELKNVPPNKQQAS